MKIISLTSIVSIASVASVFWFAAAAYFQEAPPLLIPETPPPVVRVFTPAPPVRLPVLATPPRNVPPSERCETTAVSGKHTARAEWEARQGALEDAADICPAGKVAPTGISCIPVPGEQGIMGYPAIQCTQQAACTVCGDNLTRKYELNFAQEAQLGPVHAQGQL